MHRIQGWTGLRAAVIALGLVAWTATGATAAPLTYTTSGQVDSHDRRNGHQRDQLRSAEQRQLCRPQHGPDECEPGELRHLAAGGRRIDDLHEHALPDQLPARSLMAQRR